MFFTHMTGIFSLLHKSEFLQNIPNFMRFFVFQMCDGNSAKSHCLESSHETIIGILLLFPNLSILIRSLDLPEIESLHLHKCFHESSFFLCIITFHVIGEILGDELP